MPSQAAEVTNENLEHLMSIFVPAMLSIFGTLAALKYQTTPLLFAVAQENCNVFSFSQYKWTPRLENVWRKTKLRVDFTVVEVAEPFFKKQIRY